MATSAETEASFKLAEGKSYMLDRDHAAAVRLNYQHYLWQDTLCFTFHPLVPIASLVKSNPSAAVADVACGTGLWLLGAARELPDTTTIHGLDFDLKNAPVQAWVPRNVTFKHWDLLTDVPAELMCKYDVVHVRLLILALDGEQAIRPVIHNFFKLLKPGGYLQWDEVDIAGTVLKKADPALPTPGFDGLFQKSRAGGRFDWAVKLPDFVKQEGFVDVEIEKFGDRDDLVRAFNDHHLLLMEEFALGLEKIGRTEAAKEFHVNIKDAYQESITGAAICFPRVVVVAREPVR